MPCVLNCRVNTWKSVDISYLSLCPRTFQYHFEMWRNRLGFYSVCPLTHFIKEKRLGKGTFPLAINIVFLKPTLTVLQICFHLNYLFKERPHSQIWNDKKFKLHSEVDLKFYFSIWGQFRKKERIKAKNNICKMKPKLNGVRKLKKNAYRIF